MTTDAGVVGACLDGLAPSELIEDFAQACVSRAIDDAQIRLQMQSRVFFQISGAGHEALGLALARHLRPGYDWFFPYYRDLALCLGLGVTPTEVLLQAVGSAEDPSSAGRQMPAHWGNSALHIVTGSSPMASQCIPAVGCAEAGRYIAAHPGLAGCTSQPDEITYVSLGEGACSEGEFWESVKGACLLHLPILFVVADNGYAISVPVAEQHPGSVSEMVSGFHDLEVVEIDGTDYLAARRAGRQLIDHVRSGAGPALLHAHVVRPYSHSAADTQTKYRSAAELAIDARRDPIDRLAELLVGAGALSPTEVETIRAQAVATVADAVAEALAGARPDPSRITSQVVALPTLVEGEGEDESGSAPEPDDEPVAMGEAIRLTLREALAADDRVRVFGQDVADAPDEVLDEVEGKGGVFGTTRGLQREFGRQRCFNAPLSEADIIGRAVGQGLRGLRPAPEIQFFDYIWPAMTQIRTEAATTRWRSNGAFTAPMVIRVPIGGYLTGGSIWHSQSGEGIFAHIPGLSVAMPSTAADAVGLLRYAFRCDDPVLFCEHKHLLRQPYASDPFPPPGHVIPFGRGRIRRAGDDLTLVTWGATVQKSLVAAAQVAESHGLEIEVVDLRTVAPWDHEIVAESVATTHRLLVVHEDTLTGGFGAEVAAWAGQHCFGELDAPVSRVGALDTFVAYEPTLEDAILPQVDDIATAILDVTSF